MAHPLALILRSVVNLNYASRALRSGLQRHAICNDTGITSFFARTINRSATLLLIICAFSHNWHGRGHTWGADERNRYDFGGSRSVCRNDKDRDREKTDRHEDSVRLSRPIATSSSSYDRSVVHRICYARGMINPPLIHRIRRFTHVSSRLREAKKGNQTCDTPYPAPELFGSVFPSSSALSRPLFRSAPPSPNPCQPPLTRHGHSRPRSRCSSPSRAPATKRPNAGGRIGSCGAGARVSPRKNAANVQTINALHVTRHAGASRARSCEIAARSRCTPWRMSKIACDLLQCMSCSWPFAAVPNYQTNV